MAHIDTQVASCSFHNEHRRQPTVALSPGDGRCGGSPINQCSGGASRHACRSHCRLDESGIRGLLHGIEMSLSCVVLDSAHRAKSIFPRLSQLLAERVARRKCSNSRFVYFNHKKRSMRSGLMREFTILAIAGGMRPPARRVMASARRMLISQRLRHVVIMGDFIFRASDNDIAGEGKCRYGFRRRTD